MKNIKKIIYAAGITVFLASCSFTKPYAVTNNTIGNKTGVSSTVVLFGGGSAYRSNPYIPITASGMILNKDYGILEAAKKGGIKKVATVDLKYTGYVFYGKYELIVTGE